MKQGRICDGSFRETEDCIHSRWRSYIGLENVFTIAMAVAEMEKGVVDEKVNMQVI